MRLTERETELVFSIMADLSNEFDHSEVRLRVGEKMLQLLNADYFASYTWDPAATKFVSRVQINMSDDNLRNYEEYYQFCDPITPILQRRKKATPVREVMAYDRLYKTKYYQDFLRKDGLHYGVNLFAYDLGNNIGDLRIWRGRKREDFGSREIALLDAIGPSFVNALVRATASKTVPQRFANLTDEINITSRQAEVADLLVAGLSDEEICKKLNVSKPTLRSHISAIFRKTGLSRRSQLSSYLIEKSHHK